MRIDATGVPYRELNKQIRQALLMGETEFELVGVNGQRYIGAGLEKPITMDIHGVPGNDLAAFMNGPRITVHNNAQDVVGNTMNDGRIAIHGHAGDVLGYGMRGGQMLVRDDVGYRVGIHMKAYRDRGPVIVIGGAARDFLGEYMAGGVIILLGLERGKRPILGDYCGTGMHGGEIFIRGEVDPDLTSEDFTRFAPMNEEAKIRLRECLTEFCREFQLSLDEITDHAFTRLVPLSHRPFSGKYAT